MRHLTNMVLLTVSLVLTLCTFEVIVRLSGIVSTERLTTKFLNLKPYIKEHPTRLFCNKTGITVDDNGVSVILDDNGCRTATDTVSTVSVIVMGDSTPFGWGVPYEQSYVSLLSVGLGVPISNYSVPGYNSKQLLQQYREDILPLHPKCVIIHHDNNDADPTGRYFNLQPHYGDNRLHSQLLKMILRLVASDGISKADTVRWMTITDGPLYEQHINDLRTLVSEAQADGCKVTVLAYDNFNYGDMQDRLADRISDLCQVIVLPSMYNYHISKTDWHPTPEGHTIIADTILKEIR